MLRVNSTVYGFHNTSTDGGSTTISVDGSEVTDPDFVSTGDIDFVNTAGDVTGNINAGVVDTTELADEAVTEAKLDAVDSPSDGEVLSYDSGTGRLEWVAQSGGTSDHGALTGLADDDHTQYPILDVINGTAAPAVSPSRVGAIFLDTTNNDAYIALGTSNAADWWAMSLTQNSLAAVAYTFQDGDAYTFQDGDTYNFRDAV